MKKSITKSVVLILGGCLFFSPNVLAETNLTGVIKTAGETSDQSSKQSRIEKRLSELEQLDEVPENADSLDWELAQRTSWWGKPLDPKKFWTNRVIWLDESAKVDARRHGRGYPPMPYDDQSLAKYPNDEGTNSSLAEVEGPTSHFVTSSKETAFWDKFYKTQPKPPQDIEREQDQVAETVLDLVKRNASPDRVMVYKQRAFDMGFPKEAFNDDVLLLSYILKARQKYQTLLDEGFSADSFQIKSFFRQLSVDPKYILQPLTDAQLKTAADWKINYLQRLRNEKVDASYINAYLNAWNLSAQELSK